MANREKHGIYTNLLKTKNCIELFYNVSWEIEQVDNGGKING